MTAPTLEPGQAAGQAATARLTYTPPAADRLTDLVLPLDRFGSDHEPGPGLLDAPHAWDTIRGARADLATAQRRARARHALVASSCTVLALAALVAWHAAGTLTGPRLAAALAATVLVGTAALALMWAPAIDRALDRYDARRGRTGGVQ